MLLSNPVVQEPSSAPPNTPPAFEKHDAGARAAAIFKVRSYHNFSNFSMCATPSSTGVVAFSAHACGRYS